MAKNKDLISHRGHRGYRKRQDLLLGNKEYRNIIHEPVRNRFYGFLIKSNLMFPLCSL
jgi:hypothetical protein